MKIAASCFRSLSHICFCQFVVSDSGTDIYLVCLQILGTPGTMIRLGLDRTDKITMRTFFYEINLQRETGFGIDA